ncbi:MAG: substrate-binding domain-containing protein [Beutenbergiaceae bacterium]
MRRRHIGVMGTIAALGIAFLGACGTGSTSESPEDVSSENSSEVATEDITIGVAMRTKIQPRWAYDVAAMEERAAELGVTLDVKYANDDPSTQASQIDAMVAQGVDALIVNPVSTSEAGVAIAKAREAGIVVIAYDLGVESDVDGLVTRDLMETGRMQIEAALAAAPSGNYAIIKGDPVIDAAKIFSDEYQAALEGNSDITVVYDDWTTNWDPTGAQNAAEAILTSNSDDIAAFVVSNDGMATGVVQALEAAGLTGEVFVSGLDADEANLALIAEGKQSMTIYTMVDEMGQEAVGMVVQLLNGETPAYDDPGFMNGDYATPVTYVTQVEVNQGNICEFFDMAPEGWADEDTVLGSSGITCS